MWDLGSNQAIQVAGHDAPVKVVRWVKAPNYSALMSCSWDKTVKFWDTRYSLNIAPPRVTFKANLRGIA